MDDLTWLDLVKCRRDLRCERGQLTDPRSKRVEINESDSRSGDVLLRFHAAVDRHERGKARRAHLAKEKAVFSPFHPIPVTVCTSCEESA